MKVKENIFLLGGVVFVLFLSGCGTTITGEAGGTKPQCSDGKDNDQDGFCDYLTQGTRCRDGSTPGDSACTSKTDNTECTIACTSASNCGTDGWTGSPSCGADGNVHRLWISYTCTAPGTCSAKCSSQTTDKVYQQCSKGCLNGQCLTGDGNTTNSSG